jgi:hypothetical protein
VISISIVIEMKIASPKVQVKTLHHLSNFSTIVLILIIGGMMNIDDVTAQVDRRIDMVIVGIKTVAAAITVVEADVIVLPLSLRQLLHGPHRPGPPKGDDDVASALLRFRRLHLPRLVLGHGITPEEEAVVEVDVIAIIIISIIKKRMI